MSGRDLVFDAGLSDGSQGTFVASVNPASDCSAAVQFFTDQQAWEDAVAAAGMSVEVFATSDTNLFLADEVSTLPGNGELLGPGGLTLTFDRANTGLSLDFRVTVYDPGLRLFFSNEGQGQRIAPEFDVGADDPLQVEHFGGAPLFAMAVGVRDNDDNTLEPVWVLGVADALILTPGALPLSPGGGTAFYGILSDRPIKRIVFNESGEDADQVEYETLRFATRVPALPSLPLPGLVLLALALPGAARLLTNPARRRSGHRRA